MRCGYPGSDFTIDRSLLKQTTIRNIFCCHHLEDISMRKINVWAVFALFVFPYQLRLPFLRIMFSLRFGPTKPLLRLILMTIKIFYRARKKLPSISPQRDGQLIAQQLPLLNSLKRYKRILIMSVLWPLSHLPLPRSDPINGKRRCLYLLSIRIRNTSRNKPWTSLFVSSKHLLVKAYVVLLSPACNLK